MKSYLIWVLFLIFLNGCISGKEGNLTKVKIIHIDSLTFREYYLIEAVCDYDSLYLISSKTERKNCKEYIQENNSYYIRSDKVDSLVSATTNIGGLNVALKINNKIIWENGKIVANISISPNLKGLCIKY